MVQSSRLHLNALWLHAKMCRGDPLDANGNIAETNRSMPFTDQRLADDGDRICKVKQPGLRTPASELLCNLEGGWNGSERACPAARADRLLADHTVCERNGLIKHSCSRTADSELQEAGIHPIKRLRARRSQRKASRPSRPVKHPACQSAKNL